MSIPSKIDDEDLARILQNEEIEQQEQRMGLVKPEFFVDRQDSIIAQQMQAEELMRQRQRAASHLASNRTPDYFQPNDATSLIQIQQLSLNEPRHTVENDAELAAELMTRELQIEEDHELAQRLNAAVSPASRIPHMIERSHNPRLNTVDSPTSRILQMIGQNHNTSSWTCFQLFSVQRQNNPAHFQPIMEMFDPIVRMGSAGSDMPPEDGSYEDLLEWEERRGEAVHKGMSEDCIQTLPSIVFKGEEAVGGASTLHDTIDNEENRQCKICLEDFEKDEKLKPLPCLHKYHSKCIEKWLQEKAECPVCKLNVKEEIDKTRGT